MERLKAKEKPLLTQVKVESSQILGRRLDKLDRYWGPIQEQLLRRNAKRFREGLVFKAHRRLHHSTLGLRVIKKKKKDGFGKRDDTRKKYDLRGGDDVIKLEGVPREQKMLKGHLPRVIYHQVYLHTKKRRMGRTVRCRASWRARC